MTPWLHWEEGAHRVNGWVQMAFTEDSGVKQMQMLMTGLSLSREEREGSALSFHFLPNVFPDPLLNTLWGLNWPSEPCLPFHTPGWSKEVTHR